MVSFIQIDERGGDGLFKRSSRVSPPSSSGREKKRADRKADGRNSEKPRAGAKKRSFPTISFPLWLGVTVIALAIAVCFALNALNPAGDPDGDLHVHFIDVGQGDAALLCAPDCAVLIDAGPTDARYATANYVAEHAEKLDLMILTHPHEDHIGGAAQILDRVPVTKVLTPDVTSTAAAFERTLDAIEANGVKAEIASPGDVFNVGKMRLTVLAPLSVDGDNINNCSLVVRVDYGKTSFLFTGDAERESERLMLDAYPVTTLDCDVLKVGHHGSSTSSAAEFLDALRPQIAVISVGADNDYGHPAEETLSRLAKYGAETVLRTDRDGTVTLVSDGEAVRPEE